MIKARATHTELRFEQMQQADLALFSFDELRGGFFDWFPRTSIYGGRGSRVELFTRMVSKRYFEKVKPLFGVNTVDELKEAVIKAVGQRAQQRYGLPFEYQIPTIEYALDVEKIGTVE